MKKLLLTTASLLSLYAGAAQAQINIELGGEPRTVVERHPEYYHEYGRGHHSRRYDYNYWHDNGRHEGPRR